MIRLRVGSGADSVIYVNIYSVGVLQNILKLNKFQFYHKNVCNGEVSH